MSDSMANNMASPRSARAAALERRRALSHNGAAALGAKSSAPARTAGNTAAMAAPGATGKSLSRARREALSQGGGAIESPQSQSADARGFVCLLQTCRLPRRLRKRLLQHLAPPLLIAAAAKGRRQLKSPSGSSCLMRYVRW